MQQLRLLPGMLDALEEARARTFRTEVVDQGADDDSPEINVELQVTQYCLFTVFIVHHYFALQPVRTLPPRCQT